MSNSSIMRRAIWWSLLLVALAGSAVAVWVPVRAVRESTFEQEHVDPIPAAEFARLVEALSEDEGYFRSDNFTSNETSYLHVTGKLQEKRIPRGAYIGVGPEQNFTYIAKVRPSIAFIIDIRRQAILQHLLYKAIFHISESRAEFLSHLLCRPLEGDALPDGEASVDDILKYFGSAPAPEEAFDANRVKVREIIEEDFRISLTDHDRERLEYVYSAFHKEGLEIAFRIGGSNWGGSYRRFPNLRDLILQVDLTGKPGNFLATEEDYRFVRSMQLQNRVIPVVGDFAGPKALASIGEYLRKNRYTVRAFYTSNVEQFLFQNGSFRNFVDNVRQLPVNADSVFIRGIPMRGQVHPAHVPGHRSTTVLQKISVFLKDYDDGRYTDYQRLVTTHFIAGQRP